MAGVLVEGVEVLKHSVGHASSTDHWITSHSCCEKCGVVRRKEMINILRAQSGFGTRRFLGNWFLSCKRKSCRNIMDGSATRNGIDLYTYLMTRDLPGGCFMVERKSEKAVNTYRRRGI